MRTRNLYLVLVFFYLFLSSFIQADEGCPAGMRKTYVDDGNMDQHGTGRRATGSLCYWGEPGSLYFSRKVLIEPRFEIHLKAVYDAIIPVENSGEQKVYGFTMVISRDKNIVTSYENFQVNGHLYNTQIDDIGYNNFRNALIIEFDFEKDKNDPDYSSFSIRYCGSSCSSDDRYAFGKGSIPNQKYNPGRKNNWDFRFLYKDKTIFLLSGTKEIYKASYDLERTLGTNIARVGFTGFVASTRHDINIVGSFICEDNYLMSKMKGWFYEGGRTYSERNYEPDKRIEYAFNFINNQGKRVPHTYGHNIWSYAFYITQDCDKNRHYSIRKTDDYTLLLNIQSCKTAGRHSININEDLKGSAPVSYYTVVPGPLKKINLVGHNGAIGNLPLKNDKNFFFLNFGRGNSGDFFYQNNLNIVLDFSFVDAYGNVVSHSNPASLFALKKVNANGSTANVNDKILRKSMVRKGNNYQMTLVANQIGTYQIDRNGYMDRPIRFKIIPDEPNTSRSYCTLVGYSSNPTVKVGAKFTYRCYLIDSYGNSITLETFTPNSQYDFTCQVDKTWPNSAKINPKVIAGRSTDNFYTCEYTASIIGNFQINGYLSSKKNRALTRISSKINQFYVRGNANTYIIKKIYNPSANRWIDINNSQNTKIQYKADSSGLITALDFAEADGSILISQYVKYPNDFKIADVTAELSNGHDTKFGFVQPTVKIVSMGGRDYVGIYQYDTKKTGKVVMKSSYEYTLKFKYMKKNEKSAGLQFIPNVKPYTTCFHPLDLKKTQITIANIVNLSVGGAETKIGSIILKTTDNLLYNYNIGANNIAFQLEINVNIKFRIVPLAIEGTYDVYVKANQGYQGDAKILINKQHIKSIRLQSGPPDACTISWLDAKSFKLTRTKNREYYYDYIGGFNDGNLLIEFKLLDKYKNVINDANYYKRYKDISSEQYGTNEKYFTIDYNAKGVSYRFRDNIPYEAKTRGWVFTLRERTCNYKYYVRYDGKKGGPPVKLENSYFKIINTQIDLNKEAYVEVIYKDIKNQLLGLQKEKLADLISKTEVYANKNNKRAFTLKYESTTSNHALRYKAKFTDYGDFIIVATSNKAGLKYEKTNKLTVINTIYSLAHSNLKIIIDKVIDMKTNVKVQVKNAIHEPKYKLYFYTKENRKTFYDKNKDYSLYIPVGTDKIKLQQNKNNADYVEFTFPKNELDYFKRLKKGDYKLILSDGKETITYQLNLISDYPTDHSNERNYDITKTEVKPTSINGVAGKTYTINVELRAKDNLRWNGDVELNNFKVAQTQAFKNANEYSVKIEKGSKKGQFAIHVRQTIITSNKANILSFKYKNQDISKKVSLTIKCDELKNLILIGGPTSGNVINPPKLTFKPVDAYNNLYSDLFTTKVAKAKLDSLTVGKSKDKVAITSNNALANGQYLIVQYSSKAPTNVVVTSQYYKNSYNYRISSGPIHKDKSFAEIKAASTKVGDTYVLMISPKDIYNNNVDGLNANSVKQFNVIYKTVGGKDEVKVTDCKLINNNFNIQCSAKITKAGNLQFVVKYVNDVISCKNQCKFSVIPTTLYFKNTKTLYTNKNTYLNPNAANTVEIGTTPKFQVSFYDNYNNQLDKNIVNPFRISATLEGTEVKLCISNNGNTKLITVCPTTNGDDNENVWKYLTNGNHYKLNIQNMNNNKEVIIYPITLTGGSSSGSSAPIDLSKTLLSKNSLTLIAGKEDKITMTLRTAKSERKNYWYPVPNEKIKITFEKDASTCSSNVVKANLPGIYDIKVTCTKATTLNKFSIAVEKKAISQKVTLVVKSNVAHTLEVQNPKQFTVSANKYTWAKNPSNDDTITFSYLFKDRYQNIVTDDIRKSNQYTINSDKFGTNAKYYTISNINNKYIYTFTDKINEAITKHTWNIKILDSNRIYSFIYNRIPGAPDYSKSYWTIDKSSYILKETSTINVYLVDKYGVNLGSENKRLDKERSSITVTAKKTKDFPYAYNTFTSTYVKYTYSFQDIGTYKISVKYKGKTIGQEKNSAINYQTVDLKTSKLYYNINNKNDILMSTTTQTNINSLKDYPYYKFYFYTSDGKLITLYDKSATMSCVMTYGSYSWKMDITKEDTYIKLTYTKGFEEKFHKLPLGLYYIEINHKTSVIKYPIYLLGEKNVSPSNNYDLSKTYIKPNVIEAVAGVEKEIEIEFRASDGLRWNYQVNLLSFGLSNSYKLKDPKFKYRVAKGSKNGQIKLYVKQTVATDNKNNILQLTYASKSILQTISLKITSSSLKTIKYISGVADGTVINPPTARFIPYDEYGNVCTQVFNAKEYPQTKLNQLTSGASVNKYSVTSNIYTKDGYLYVQYGCQKVTSIKITSKYFKETYTYKLLSGPIDSGTSFAQIAKDKGVIAGDLSTLNIYPRDIYSNEISSLTKKDLTNFEVQYNVNGGSFENIINGCSINKNYIICKTNINKSGEVKLAIEYNDKEVKCNNCKFTINPNVLDFSKTKLIDKNTNKEMSKTAVNVLTSSTSPSFELNFYDKFMNAIIDQSQVKKLNVETKIEVTDIKLCVETSNLIKKSQLCKSTANDENENRWKYIPNGNKYKLYVNSGKQSLIYPIQINGGYNDGSSGPFDISKTNINPSSLTLTAGVQATVNVELRTKDNIRKNYWYSNIQTHLSVKLPDNTCQYIISNGAKPGQYKFKFTCTKKYDSYKPTIVVENKDVPTKLNMKIVPNQPTSSKLYYTNNKEIKAKELQSVTVEDKLQLINEFYDKYNNLITNINFDLSILKIQITPTVTVENYKYNADIAAQKNGKVIITLTSTYAGEHNVVGALLPLKQYSIKFTHGVPCAANSILEASKTEAWVAETVKIYITPYDKYFNLIDADEFKKTSPYQIQYTNHGSTNKLKMQKYAIETVNKVKVLSYSQAFYVRGYADLYGYIGSASVKCESSRINIKSKDIDFKSSLVMRYELSKNDYEILKNGITEQNTKEEPIYRLYPRDAYLNTIDYIPDDKLNNYQARLIAQSQSVTYELILNNKGKTNQSYAEFVIYDDPKYTYTYATLTRGYYTLLFTDGIKTISYNISLFGDEYGGSNEEADFQKTHINEQKLNFLAGESGYLMLEIRTAKDIRKKYWNYDIKVTSCDDKDTTYNATSEKAGLIGIFQVTITTKKANTYPKLVKCPLKIYIDNVLVKNLSPELEVSPNEVTKTTILNNYYKKNSNTELKEGDADNNYIFEVSSFDQYNNLAETVQDTIDLKVSLEGEDIDKITSETDTSTGYRKYSVTATKYGTYVVSTAKSGPQGIYLGKEATFLINPGVIDLTKNEIKEKTSPIQAGNKPEISIAAFDKYDNALYYSNYINKFVVVFIDANNKEFKSTPTYDEVANKVYYTSKADVTVVGNVTVEITYDNKEKIDTSNITIEIIPADPYAPHSILSEELETGEQVQYFNQNKIEIDTTKPLKLNMTLYDKYKNYVYLLPVSAEVLNPIMSGKRMKEIKFNVEKNEGNFDLDFNGNDNYKHIYEHLVKGIYDFTLKVKTDLGESNFIYNLEITAGDDLHGNGDIYYPKCVLSPLTTSFVAGNYEQFTLELRTEEGLLYNDDIDINKDLKIYIDTIDNSFQYSVIKAGDIYGIYNITIYSELKGEYTLNVELNNNKLNQIKYTVTPDPIPDKNYTIILSRPKDEVNAGELQYVKYSLYDKFNNPIVKSDNIINTNNFSLSLSNEQKWSYSSLNFESNTDLILTFMAVYPPRKMIFNLDYNGVQIFDNNIEVSVRSFIDYSSTLIVSDNKEKIKAGDFLDMLIYTYDKNGECIDYEDYHSHYKVEVKGPLDSTKQYTTTYQLYKTNGNIQNDSECHNEYSIHQVNLTNPENRTYIHEEKHRYKYAGNYIIKVYAKNNLIAQYNQICYPLNYSPEGFYLKYDFDPEEISILDEPSFTITGTDIYGNIVKDPLNEDINIYFTQNLKNTTFEVDKKESPEGTLNYKVNIHKVGEHQLHIKYKNEEIEKVNNGQDLPIFNILPGQCYADDNKNIDLSPLNDTEINMKTHFIINCYDQFFNKITEGGESFKVSAEYLIEETKAIVPLEDATVIDNKDGSYNVEFIPVMKGIYRFNILLDKKKYGQTVVYKLEEFQCTSGENNILCPNKKLCVSNILDCIEPKGNCTIEKPFYCKVNGELTCTKSQTDCDCPEGYIKCKMMNYCVPKEREDMCPNVKAIFSLCLKNNLVPNDDGICRKEHKEPNQRVCPIGKVLCADLSCRDNYEQCIVTEELDGLSQRCIGQQIVSSPNDCPSSITCPKKEQVVCPTGECVDNEIECPRLTRCNDKYPYLCQNDVCAKSYDACPLSISCGENRILCPDNICRERC